MMRGIAMELMGWEEGIAMELMGCEEGHSYGAHGL